MPSNGNPDKAQQPLGSGLNSVYGSQTRHGIWRTYPASHTRGGSLSQDPAENTSNGTHIGREGTFSNYPWNDDNDRSSSSSPSRTRNGAIPRAPTFGNGAEASGMSNGLNGHGRNGFTDNGMARSTNDASFFETLSSIPATDPSGPPSRQSQASPGYGDLFNGRTNGHAQSSSFSQRAMPSNGNGSSHQANNSQAFSLNQQLGDHMGMPYGRRGAAEHGKLKGMSSQSSQLNPGSQPFADTNGSRFGPAFAQDSALESLASSFSTLRRPSDSPSASYYSEGNSTIRNFPNNAGPWNVSAALMRDAQAAELERRDSAQAYAGTSYSPGYYSPQPSYPLTPQHANNYLEQQYPQAHRQAMLSSYNMPYNMPYPLSGTLPQIHTAADGDRTRGLRSARLEEYKNNKGKKHELKDFYTYMVEFSGDQHGSRFIQGKLETANSDEKEQVFREIEPNAIQLMQDVFGNYVVQKFFVHGNQVQKKMLANKLKTKMVDLSLQVYACRVVQKALEHVLVDQQLELVQELSADILKVIKDGNGNHVVQRIITLVDRKHLDFLMEAISGNVMALSNHQYGCRVIQRMMDHGTPQDRDSIIAELRPSAHLLLPDQYGNYVAQHIIQHGSFQDRERMVRLVLDQLVDLCKHKYASNVVETCIIHGVPELRTMIRERFEQVGSDGTSILSQLLKDSYGNYVIQKMATFLHGEEQNAFVEQIRPLFSNFKKSGNVRQISAMEKMFEQHSYGELKPDKNTYGQVRPVAPAPGITQEPGQSPGVSTMVNDSDDSTLMTNGITTNGDGPGA
ncbi:pumilio domain-containing protein [Emericellopsis atlantica]|uniref:Pumilio domain-containing protein n=1 Tax=Emericellopsis atlantica TaxID=2614577 RepID=A0A9P7ZT11_9HYPO|nr:pumilio domain-containing protein [Emericellopsis atlantica]KAG9257271.1 pumilio domain-containing protein [Emericellopsis atlantica]